MSKLNLEIKKNIVSEFNYKNKCPYDMDSPIGVTVHNTGNSATADNEIAYMISNPYEISFHYCVDESYAVQGIPLNRNTWHASDGHGDGNMRTISIEIARSTHSDENLFREAEKNGAKLVAILLTEHNWTINDVYTHQHWAIDKKYCPHKTLDWGWQRFLQMVQGYLDELKPQPEPQPEPSVLYRVQVGAYSVVQNVVNMYDRLKADGYGAIIKWYDGMYHVQVGAYSVKSNATRKEKEIASKGYPTTITDKTGTDVSISELRKLLAVPKAGNEYNLNNCNVYNSAVAQTIGKRTGKFYVWSNEIVNNRIRMTNSANNVGVGGQVSFWIDVSDLG